MNYYIIKLILLIGEYEKNTITVIKAENEGLARLHALRGESHGDDADFDSNGNWWDMEEMVYKVDMCKQITREQYDTYLNIINPYTGK